MDNIFHVYSRKQAIQDGVLVDVTETAKEAGFRFPVAVTREVWGKYIVPSDYDAKRGQDVSGRLWDTLWMLRLSSRKGGSNVLFSVIFQMLGRETTVQLRAVVGPGDKGEPVITIMMPDEA